VVSSSPSPSALIDSGSFRDRDSRVFRHHGQVHRLLSERGLADWEALARTRFFPRLVASGKVVRSERVELPPELLRELPGSWAATLAHETLPFVSYPYEWSFAMLREAARLQLELVAEALAEDMTLKDASAYNLQWRGVEPVFIDVGSFQRLRQGDPWVGYLQFCQLFLYPLLLTAYKDVPFHPWLRGSIDGIAPEPFAALMSWRDRLRPGVLAHGVLQAKLQARTAGSGGDGASLRGELARSGFDKRLIVANVERLRRLVDGLQWQRARSTWSEYAQDNSYTPEDRERKQRFVTAAAARRRWGLAWDLGSNTGEYSRIAAAHAEWVVAMDADHLTVDRMFHALRRDGVRNVLPLYNNLADPSPDLGWRGVERRSLEHRRRPELTLALALLHHLVLAANLPLAEVLDWMRGLGSHLVLEMVTKDDPMARRLLRDKDDTYTDYVPEELERLLGARFEVLERLPLASGTRTLYSLAPR
jgi:hypothetical protein